MSATVTPSTRVTSPKGQPVVGQVVTTKDKGTDKPDVQHVSLARQICNFGTGLRNFGKAYRAWELATEYDPEIAALRAAGDARGAATILAKQIEESDKRKVKTAKIRVRTLKWCWPILACGWTPLTMIFILLAVGAALLAGRKKPLLAAAKAEHAILMALTSTGITAGNMLMIAAWGDTSPDSLLWSSRWYLLTPGLETGGLLVAVLAFLAWVWHAARRDATVADNMPGVQAPAPEERRKNPSIVDAVLAAGRLPKGTTPVLVGPVKTGNDDMIWTATVDTLGPSATVLLEAKARAELAARLGLSLQRLIATVDEDCGSRLHLTGITGQPWRKERHPLMALAPIDLWDGIPHGPTIEGDQVIYRVEGVNALYGGESGSGKSTALAGVWAGFALAPASRIYAIDGGEVDTEPLRRSGLATAWTTDLAEGTRILAEVLAAVDHRQHLLASAELRKVNPAFFAEHGIGFDLLLIDELARFTQGTGPEGKEFAESLRQILQRARKTGIHVLLSTQSPSVDAIDADARDVIPVRWCGRARSADLAAKVLGKGTIGRGVDPRNLPVGVDGVGWYSAPGREVQVRPYGLEDGDLKVICARGVELRRGAQSLSAADDDRVLASRVADLIRDRGVTVPAGRVMLARDVATTLDAGQDTLRLTLARAGIRTQRVSRPDDQSAHNHAHYVLADFPVSRAI